MKSASVRFEQGGKKGKAGEGLLQWDSKREKVLQSLVQLIQVDIRSLWSLSLVEEEFIRYFAYGCSTALVLAHIFDVLGRQHQFMFTSFHEIFF